MGLELDLSISAITVFAQGILSFFSPCVLPIIPLYMGYLSGGTMAVDDEGRRVFDQKKVLISTVFFIIGVSFAFFLLGLGFSTLGQFFTQNQQIFSRVGGALIILLGLAQLGVFKLPFNGREFKLNFALNLLKMNPITAFLMGFTFSFAWTPCVGPALATVLIIVSSTGNMSLIAVYTLGFTLPFLMVGIFTTKCLDLFRTHANIVAYTVKIGATIMILMGALMLTGTMYSLGSYLSQFGAVEETAIAETATVEPVESPEPEPDDETSEEIQTIAAPDFELIDQFGEVHSLSDYSGQVIFLNIWATWCPYCLEEMPEIQQLYEHYGENEGDVAVLGLAFPSDENSYTQEGSMQSVIDYLAEENLSYPTLMDTTGELLYSYGISSFPMTFMIDASGNVYGYLAGMISYEVMVDIVEQTLEASGL